MCLREVYKVREKAGQRFELEVPSFVLQPGEFLALIGTSGCGKSTLLDMLALVLRPTTAETSPYTCHTGRNRVKSWSYPKRHWRGVRGAEIGYVLQTGGLLPVLDGQRKFMLPCRLNGMGRIEKDFQALVERLGIEDQLTKKPQFLSTGQRQRVAIARALIHRPRWCSLMSPPLRWIARLRSTFAIPLKS